MRDGSFIFLAVLLVGFFAVVFGYFTRTGSGINPRPYGKIYGHAPGANTPGEVSGRDPQQARVSDWSRGTR
jgi:hypothetical protein